MTDNVFVLALREVREDLSKRTALVVMGAMGVILGISGPFDTFEALPVFPRILYWVAVVVLTFSLGSLVDNLVHKALRQQPDWLRLGVTSCAIGVAVTGFLLFFNFLIFGPIYASLRDILELLAAVIVIAGVVETCSYLLRSPPEAEVQTVPLLDRLPLDKRGGLIALSAEDHYVRVTTTKGTDLVLMRLSDAIKEVGSAQGLQIHRSHWVALEPIAKVTRTGDRGEIVLADGAIRPISRGYMPAVRAAGLLP